MDYRVDDKQLNASDFLSFVNQIWPGSYDAERTQSALAKTLNITAYDGAKLVGCLRILSDGFFSERSRNCWSFRNTRIKAWEAACFNWQKPTRPPCCISVRSRA